MTPVLPGAATTAHARLDLLEHTATALLDRLAALESQLRELATRRQDLTLDQLEALLVQRDERDVIADPAGASSSARTAEEPPTSSDGASHTAPTSVAYRTGPVSDGQAFCPECAHASSVHHEIGCLRASCACERTEAQAAPVAVIVGKPYPVPEHRRGYMSDKGDDDLSYDGWTVPPPEASRRVLAARHAAEAPPPAIGVGDLVSVHLDRGGLWQGTVTAVGGDRVGVVLAIGGAVLEVGAERVAMAPRSCR